MIQEFSWSGHTVAKVNLIADKAYSKEIFTFEGSPEMLLLTKTLRNFLDSILVHT